MIKHFQKIKGWTVDNHNTSHDLDLAWLLKEIHSIQQVNKKVKKRSQKRLILVVTHHAPSLERTSSPQHSQNPWKSAFGTDILTQPLNDVKVWIFGHTHYTTDFRKEGVRVVSNQRGYVLPWVDSTAIKDGFDVRKVIHL
jgi:Icc-related predicted phosphoesterase